jgi:hypothetical protein
VAAFTVFSRIAGGGGIGEKGAGRRIELRQAAVIGAEVRAKRIVAAGVEDDQVECIAGAGQAVEQQAEINCLALDVGF